jgi:glutathione S-transferase
MVAPVAVPRRIVLWQIPVSHYNEKARWALDYKSIPHLRREPLPGLHRISALWLTRGKHDRLPVIELEGARIGDSTAIIAALEQYQPEPALYPSDPDGRERALALEDYFDEELGPKLRRFYWYHTLRDRGAAIDAALPDAGSVRRRLAQSAYPVMRRAAARDYGADERGAAEALEGMRSVMDRLEDELADGDYLVGDSFSVADLAAASLFTAVIAPEERPYAPDWVAGPVQAAREELSARRGGQWVIEMYRRHRGRSAAVGA